MMESWEWRRVFDSLPGPTPEQLAEVRARRLKEWQEEVEEFDRKWAGRTVKHGGTETRRHERSR